MSTVATSRAAEAPFRLPRALDRRFEAVVFDWDATVVSDGGGAPAAELRCVIEELCSRGLDLVAIAGTDVANVDGPLAARPTGPGRLFFCANRGSEVFEAREDGLELLHRRVATPDEASTLDAAAGGAVQELRRRGVPAQVVSHESTRRTIGLLPAPDPADPPQGRPELLAVVEERARAAGPADPRVTSDAKHLEIGLTDKADSARWAFAELARRGIGSGLVLLAGGEFGPIGGPGGGDSLLLVPQAARATVLSVGAERSGAPPEVLVVGGGAALFLRVLQDQLERRRRGDVPELDGDPEWTLVVEGLDHRLERVHESLLTLADGRLGTRGAPLFDHPSETRGVLCSGVYVGEGPATELAPCRDWTQVEGAAPKRRRVTRRLDLATGLLREEDRTTSLRFSSLARPGTVALRATRDPQATRRRVRRQIAPVAAVIRDRSRGEIFERIGAYDPEERVAQAALAAAGEAGFERLLREHREAWARRWAGADVVVEGDAELQRAVRFALFHLIGSVADEGEAAVGARGLSGSAYRGHVFWDSDVFVLPFLAATHPAAARAMLEYRVRRLPAAREAARKAGRAGARFAWESAADGSDVTPSSARLATGEPVPIRTGRLEEHIVGDVAWAASCYLDWTGDDEFAAGPGRELFVETARYWASRVRYDRGGRAHVYGVIGPDEYHEPVDDNAFTNVLARWNLRRAAAVDGVDEAERTTWLAVADALVDGYDPASGVYEQFAGFYGLEPLVIEEVASRRPIAADLLLGIERTRQAQVLKQPDVLMLHHLLPEEVAPGSLVPNLDFYEPRTAHGSSLSPAIIASVLARAGRHGAALDALRIAAHIDLDDLTGSTAGGLHLATMGGLWQALAVGFAGVRPRDGRLVVDPRLPPQWNALELSLQFRGTPLRLRIDRNGVTASPAAWLVRQRDNVWEVWGE